jgi:integrase
MPTMAAETLDILPLLAHHAAHANHFTPTSGGEKSVRNQRKPLSDATIRALQPPDKGYRIEWDALAGFGCRISQAGTRAFVVLIESGRPHTIGRYPVLSLAEARREAKRLLAEKTLGHVRPTHTAFEDARKHYIAECHGRVRAGAMKQSTLKNYTLLLEKYLPFGRQSIADITPRQIKTAIDHLTPSMKEHCVRCFRTFFRWAIRQHLIDRSPMEKMAPVHRGRPRARVLTEDELRAVWTTARASTGHFHAIVALLILTGARRGEMAALQWQWIGPDHMEWPPEAVKNGRRHRVPIGPVAQSIIASLPRFSDRYVFPAARQRTERTTVINGWSKAKAAFDKECGVTGWTLHDLRRTFATNLQRLGIRLEVTEALLGHVSGTRAGIVGVYQQYGFWPEQVRAVQEFERWLLNPLGGGMPPSY